MSCLVARHDTKHIGIIFIYQLNTGHMNKRIIRSWGPVLCSDASIIISHCMTKKLVYLFHYLMIKVSFSKDWYSEVRYSDPACSRFWSIGFIYFWSRWSFSTPVKILYTCRHMVLSSEVLISLLSLRKATSMNDGISSLMLWPSHLHWRMMTSRSLAAWHWGSSPGSASINIFLHIKKITVM